MDPIPRKSPGKFPVRYVTYILLVAILMTLSVCALAAVMIRSLDSFLLAAGETEFAEIFAQLESAELDTHGWIPFLLAAAFLCLCGLLFRKIRRWVWLPAVPLGLVMFALSLAAAVWNTDVNGIRFGTVAVSLLDLLESGVF